MTGPTLITILSALCLLAGCQGQSIAQEIANAKSGVSPPPTPGVTPAAASSTPAGPEVAVAAPDATAAGAPLAETPAATTSLGASLTPVAAYTAPVAKYLSSDNSSFYSITWTAIEAANLADFFNNPDLAVTIFAPTNAAWQTRLPTMTRPNDILAHDLFSVGKSDALRGIMQYHVVNTVIKSASKIKGALSTLSNLCSNAKDLKAVQSQGSITLESAGGIHAHVLDKGVKLGTGKGVSTLFPIDDVLLPDVVTIPLIVALEAYDSRVSGIASTIEVDAPAIAQLDQVAASGPFAPTYPLPASPDGAVIGTTSNAGRR